MALISQYEDAAVAFLDDFPHGTLVRQDRVLQWAGGYADGLAEDMAITDPKKRLSALIRHLNEGGRSAGLAENVRFKIVRTDTRNGTLTVFRLRDVVRDDAEDAVNQAVRGAIGPFNRSLRAIDGLKVEELSEEEQAEFSELREGLAADKAPVAHLLDTIVTDRTVRLLGKAGLSEQNARLLIDQHLGLFTSLQKTRRLLA